MNVFSILQGAAERWPGDTAVVHQGRRLRYSELRTAAESVALTLGKAGVKPGDKVGLMCANGPEYIFALFGVLRVGAIVVPIPPELKFAEVAALGNEIAVDAYCYSAPFKPLFAEKERSYEIAACADRPPLLVQSAAHRRTSEAERKRLLDMNTASIRFSSGTTANAKGILVSHATLMERLGTHSEAPPLSRGDSVLWLQSMARGLPTYIATYLLLGVKIIIGDPVKTEAVRELLAQEKVTVVEGTRLFYQMMLTLDGIAAADLAGVRYFISTGAALPDQIAAAFRARFGREIVQHYGLAECGKVLAHLSEDARKRGSVGKPVSDREIKLGSSESDAGAIGEILVRGPGLFDAYYKPWRLREEVLEDGWFRTGDVARRDADGYYWIVGRTKEVINVGGKKVFPQEIEAVLLSHPAIEEAVVYGAPEPRFGEAPRAKVKLRAGACCTAKEILRYANERLSVFKALRAVEFVAEIPKTGTGKPRRAS